MKKILLATTLLAASVGYASAEVAVSGSARMGIVNDGTDTQFTSRVRIGFAGSGTTDGGLTFGASVRADQSGQGGTANGDSTVNISGAFGTLTMGDVAGGAADNLVGQVSGVGFTGNGDNNEIGFLGGTATAARYNYTAGSLSLAIGVGQPTAADEAKSIAMAYTFGAYAIAVGYSDTATDSQVDAKGTATFGPVTASLRVADRDSAADMATAISFDYAAGALKVTAFAGQNVDFAGKDTAGIGASYDLGGGASVAGGFSDNSVDTVMDLGINLSF
jgi:outer membrane protein OmpU